MDCRIKHALGAAEGRTRVSGNDGLIECVANSFFAA